jgi:hypothetical protein
MLVHLILENYVPGMALSFAQVAKRKKKQWKGKDHQEVQTAVLYGFFFSSLKSRSTFMLTDFPFHLGSILQIGIAVIVMSQPSLILFAFGKP